MSEQKPPYNAFTRRGIKFNDGSSLEIVVTRGEAEMAFLYHFLATLEHIRREIAQERGICCDELKNVLGKTDRYPRLAYISSIDWQANKYPGATGSGFYKIYEVRTPINEEDQITYRPLDFCPFCHTGLWNE